jgi:hypothetical protein
MIRGDRGFVIPLVLSLLLSTSRARADPPIGLRFDGEAEVDRLCDSVAGGADLNGDGVPDIIVTAPNVGSAYAFSGATGSLLWRFQGAG